MRRISWVVLGALLSFLETGDAIAQCAHDLCVQDGALDPSCDPCVAQVCRADSECCEFDWDQNCVQAVTALCEIPCGACTHALCEAGDPLTSDCHPCVASICEADPDCCAAEWDESCVRQVEARCGLGCFPSADDCEDAIALPPLPEMSMFGTLVGASRDGCSSGGEGSKDSCRAPDIWYSYTVETSGTLRISTCATRRPFGVDTIVSVHSSCPGKLNNELDANDDWRVYGDPTACPTPDLTHDNFDLLDSAVCLPVGDGECPPPTVNIDDPDPTEPLDPGQTVWIRVTHFIEQRRGQLRPGDHTAHGCPRACSGAAPNRGARRRPRPRPPPSPRRSMTAT